MQFISPPVTIPENEIEIISIDSDSDVEYVEKVQAQEALAASLDHAQANDESSSVLQARPTSSSSSKALVKEVAEPSDILCEICFETKEIRQMFKNSTCTHSFCNDCTTKHIIAKIQDNAELVSCPGLNCKTMLDFEKCRSMMPKDVLVKWDENMCKSMILDTQQLYCPFNDCSALFIYDMMGNLPQIKCPVCKRSFCATCCIPWHDGITCEEFTNANKTMKEDDMVEALAEKNKWKKCPNCKFMVSRSTGCSHITCRCKYEFCYVCGSSWTMSHYACGLANNLGFGFNRFMFQ